MERMEKLKTKIREVTIEFTAKICDIADELVRIEEATKERKRIEGDAAKKPRVKTKQDVGLYLGYLRGASVWQKPYDEILEFAADVPDFTVAEAVKIVKRFFRGAYAKCIARATLEYGIQRGTLDRASRGIYILSSPPAETHDDLSDVSPSTPQQRSRHPHGPFDSGR